MATKQTTPDPPPILIVWYWCHALRARTCARIKQPPPVLMATAAGATTAPTRRLIVSPFSCHLILPSYQPRSWLHEATDRTVAGGHLLTYWLWTRPDLPGARSNRWSINKAASKLTTFPCMEVVFYRSFRQRSRWHVLPSIPKKNSIPEFSYLTFVRSFYLKKL